MNKNTRPRHFREARPAGFRPTFGFCIFFGIFVLGGVYLLYETSHARGCDPIIPESQIGACVPITDEARTPLGDFLALAPGFNRIFASREDVQHAMIRLAEINVQEPAMHVEASISAGAEQVRYFLIENKDTMALESMVCVEAEMDASGNPVTAQIVNRNYCL